MKVIYECAYCQSKIEIEDPLNDFEIEEGEGESVYGIEKFCELCGGTSAVEFKLNWDMRVQQGGIDGDGKNAHLIKYKEANS